MKTFIIQIRCKTTWQIINSILGTYEKKKLIYKTLQDSSSYDISDCESVWGNFCNNFSTVDMHSTNIDLMHYMPDSILNNEYPEIIN